MTQKYRTFKRSATSLHSWAAARKFKVDSNLTIEEARCQCAQFNDNRTSNQIRKGTKMEFEAQ